MAACGKELFSLIKSRSVDAIILSRGTVCTLQQCVFNKSTGPGVRSLCCLVRDQSSMTLNNAFDPHMGPTEGTNNNEVQMVITALSV